MDRLELENLFYEVIGEKNYKRWANFQKLFFEMYRKNKRLDKLLKKVNKDDEIRNL